MWNSSTWLYSHKIHLSHAGSCLLFSFVRPAYFLAFIGTTAFLCLELYTDYTTFSQCIYDFIIYIFIQSDVCIILDFSLSSRLTDCLINLSRQSLINVLSVQFQVYWLVFTVGQIYLIVYLLLWHRFSIQNLQLKIFQNNFHYAFKNSGESYIFITLHLKMPMSASPTVPMKYSVCPLSHITFTSPKFDQT